MRVLIACEESQRVCIAFRERGHEAYSCDIQECSGGHPEWHIKQNVLMILDGYCAVYLQNGKVKYIDGKWDLIVAHPPCTYLTVTGNRWFNEERYGDKARQRKIDRKKAIVFFLQIANADCDKIAIENPIGVVSTAWRKPDQIIQPYMFGEPERKSTCLWLKNLPKLNPTTIVKPNIIHHKSGKTDSKWHFETISLLPTERAKERSKTFEGIATAMAEQWGQQ